MNIGDLVRYVCFSESQDKRCGRCDFCDTEAGMGLPSIKSNRTGIVVSKIQDDKSYWTLFDFGFWDVWDNDVEIINEGW